MILTHNRMHSIKKSYVLVPVIDLLSSSRTQLSWSLCNFSSDAFVITYVSESHSISLFIFVQAVTNMRNSEGTGFKSQSGDRLSWGFHGFPHLPQSKCRESDSISLLIFVQGVTHMRNSEGTGFKSQSGDRLSWGFHGFPHLLQSKCRDNTSNCISSSYFPSHNSLLHRPIIWHCSLNYWPHL
jgi:hypothetical protein